MTTTMMCNPTSFIASLTALFLATPYFPAVSQETVGAVGFRISWPEECAGGFELVKEQIIVASSQAYLKVSNAFNIPTPELQAAWPYIEPNRDRSLLLGDQFTCSNVASCPEGYVCFHACGFSDMRKRSLRATDKNEIISKTETIEADGVENERNLQNKSTLIAEWELIALIKRKLAAINMLPECKGRKQCICAYAFSKVEVDLQEN